VSWELVTRNAAALVKPPKAKRTFKAKPLTKEEAERFLQQTISNRDEALYSVALSLGLRQGEALGLRWSDIDLEQGVLHVRHQLQWTTDKPSRPALVEPKTSRSVRTLTMPPTVIADLKAHRRRQLEEQLLAGGRWQGQQWDLVFPTSIGTPYHHVNLLNRFEALLRKAGLEERRYHDPRHSCASFLVAKGVHPRVVMQYLGHADFTTSMKIYSHVELDSIKEATDAMDDLFDLKTAAREPLG
jgi:integrase